MSEQERYLKYITAHRAGDKAVIEKMLLEGFRPERQRLVELAEKDKVIRDALFNKKITIRIDVGRITGHVYGDFPYYDEEQDKILESSFGYYAEEERFPRSVFGPGIVRDERHETERITESFPKQEVDLPLTEESWIKLAHWITKKRKDKSYYILIGQNCSRFVDSALKEAGYADGLMDKFDPEKVQSLDFRVIKIDMVQYFRYDKRELYHPHAQIPILDSHSEDLQSGVVAHLLAKAKEERSQSARQSHENQVNAFFDKYHDTHFYKTYFKDKPLTIEDINWFARNSIAGLEKQSLSLTASPKLATQALAGTPFLCFSDRKLTVEKQQRLQAFKQQIAQKQQALQFKTGAASYQGSPGIRSPGETSLYFHPTFPIELPLVPAIKLEQSKSIAKDNGLKVSFVD